MASVDAIVVLALVFWLNYVWLCWKHRNDRRRSISELGSLSLSCTAVRLCRSLFHRDRGQFVRKLPGFCPLRSVGLEHWPVPRWWLAFLFLQCSNLHRPSFRMQISWLCSTRPTRWVNSQLPFHTLTLRNLLDNSPRDQLVKPDWRPMRIETTSIGFANAHWDAHWNQWASGVNARMHIQCAFNADYSSIVNTPLAMFIDYNEAIYTSIYINIFTMYKA